jgi:hypothetical protein
MGQDVKARRRMPTDPQRLARVRRMPRRKDGTVGVRAVARSLGIGRDAARRLLQMTGLFRTPKPATPARHRAAGTAI